MTHLHIDTIDRLDDKINSKYIDKNIYQLFDLFCERLEAKINKILLSNKTITNKRKSLMRSFGSEFQIHLNYLEFDNKQTQKEYIKSLASLLSYYFNFIY